MSKITVWKCDTTGKLFEDKVKYSSHLRKIVKQRIIRRKLTVIETEADTWWAAAYEREMTVDQFKQFVIDNQIRFWAENVKRNDYSWDRIVNVRKGTSMPIPELLEFTTFDLSWNPTVSNSHSAPHNGKSNWGGREGDTVPRSYPGWSGRIEWIVKWPKEWDGFYPGSDLFKGQKTRTYTGSGGGGGMRHDKDHNCNIQSFGYSFNMFAADWPGMARVIGMNQMEEVLRGTRGHIEYAV